MVETLWAVAVQPLVMGLAGASIQFSTLPSGVALKALALAAIGEHANRADHMFVCHTFMCHMLLIAAF